jgi:hypothetical protein
VAAGLATGSSGIITELLPGSESLVRTLIDLADDIGEALLVLAWIGVSLLILGGAWLTNRMIGAWRGPRLEQWPGAAAPQPPPGGAGNVFARLAQKGFGAKRIGTLKRLPGQDHWRS